MKIGLIMEGGGMSGVFTAGVMDVLMRNEITFDGAIGVSAGAIIGVNIKSEQIGRVIRFNKKYCNDVRYVSLHSLLKTGNIFGADFCYNELTYHLDPFDYKKFSENQMEFFVVCTDVATGKPVYHKLCTGLQDDILWCRASASMPLVSQIVEIDEKKYLDGGIADSIPIKYMQQIGYSKNIIILTKPLGYVMKPAKYLTWARIIYKDYPDFINAISARHIVYNKTMEYISEMEKKKEVIVIRPSCKTHAGVIEKKPENLQKTYDDGVYQCTKLIKTIRQFIEK